MPKRTFRKSPPAQSAGYPTLERFDHSRRRFLAELGASLVGAAALGSLLAACGDRAVNDEPDSGVGPAGVAPLPDSRADTLEPDAHLLSGAAPAPDAGIDLKPDPPHPGYAPAPDARGDDSGSCPNP